MLTVDNDTRSDDDRCPWIPINVSLVIFVYRPFKRRFLLQTNTEYRTNEGGTFAAFAVPAARRLIAAGVRLSALARSISPDSESPSPLLLATASVFAPNRSSLYPANERSGQFQFLSFSLSLSLSLSLSHHTQKGHARACVLCRRRMRVESGDSIFHSVVESQSTRACDE